MENKELLEVLSELNGIICKQTHVLADAANGLEGLGHAKHMMYSKRNVKDALSLLLHMATANGVRNGTLTVGNICKYQDAVVNAVSELAGEKEL